MSENTNADLLQFPQGVLVVTPLFYSANYCVLPAIARQIKAFLEIEGPYPLAFFIVSINSPVLFYSVGKLPVFPLFLCCDSCDNCAFLRTPIIHSKIRSYLPCKGRSFWEGCTTPLFYFG